MSTARQIADDIQAQIDAGKVPPGGLVGTEADLRAHHGISLVTLRQTIRILEQRQIAVMRRGVNGGLYAEQPTVDATANYVAAVWERSNTARKAMLHDALAFDALVLRRASERMTLEDAATIVRLHNSCQEDNEPIVRSARALQREQAIAQQTGNPVIVLGQAAMVRYLRNVIPFEDLAWDDPDFAVTTRQLVDAKIGALVAGDVATAIRAANDYTLAYFNRMESVSRRVTQHAKAGTQARAESLPMLVSRTVLREIRERGWNEGEFLGQEPALMERYNVGRNTWRQALSILMEYSAVESRRGAGGGLYVAPINRAAILETARAWLLGQGATLCDGLELFVHLAPHHAAATLSNERSVDDGQAITCKTLLDRALAQGASPLLTLAGLVVAPSIWNKLSQIDLTHYHQAVSGGNLVKRMLLNEISRVQNETD